MSNQHAGIFTIKTAPEPVPMLMNALAKAWTIPDDPPSSPGCFLIPSYALLDRRSPVRPTRAQVELAYEWWQRCPQAEPSMSPGNSQRLHIPNSPVMIEYALGVLPWALHASVSPPDRPGSQSFACPTSGGSSSGFMNSRRTIVA